MTDVEGMPESEDQMKHQLVLSRCFGFRDSDLFRHWSFVIVIRISAGSSSRGPSGIKPVSKELVRFVPEVQNAKQRRIMAGGQKYGFGPAHFLAQLTALTDRHNAVEIAQHKQHLVPG